MPVFWSLRCVLIDTTTVDRNHSKQFAAVIKEAAVKAIRKHTTAGAPRKLLHLMPQPMKAAYIKQKGPAENIIYGDLPQPKPAGSEVLVKVGAVSVNPIDTYIRAGTAPMPLPMPY